MRISSIFVDHIYSSQFSLIHPFPLFIWPFFSFLFLPPFLSFSLPPLSTKFSLSWPVFLGMGPTLEWHTTNHTVKENWLLFSMVWACGCLVLAVTGTVSSYLHISGCIQKICFLEFIYSISCCYTLSTSSSIEGPKCSVKEHVIDVLHRAEHSGLHHPSSWHCSFASLCVNCYLLQEFLLRVERHIGLWA